MIPTRLFTRLLDVNACTIGWTYLVERRDCDVVLAPLSRRALALGNYRVVLCNCPPGWDTQLVESRSPNKLLLINGKVPPKILDLLEKAGFSIERGDLSWAYWAMILDVSIELASTLVFMSLEDSVNSDASLSISEGIARELLRLVTSMGITLPSDPLRDLIDFWGSRRGIPSTLAELIHGVRPWILDYTLRLIVSKGREYYVDLPMINLALAQLESLYESMKGKEKFTTGIL